ncbi:hypothetical protein D3C78_997190 [compost metagenome]
MEQLAGLGADRQDLPAQAHGQQPLPGRLEVLAPAMKSQDDLIGEACVEHSTLNLADGHGEQRGAVMHPSQRAFAGQVEDTEDIALRAVNRHRGAGKIGEAVEVVFTTIDQGWPRFHQRSAQRIGAASGFAPAGTEGDVLQATALETVGAPFDSENGRIGVGEDNQPFLALTLSQVINGRHRRIDQQAIARQQHFQAGARLQRQFVFAVEVHAMAETAPP